MEISLSADFAKTDRFEFLYPRFDANLFQQFSRQGVGGHLVALDLAARELPERAVVFVRRALLHQPAAVSAP